MNKALLHAFVITGAFTGILTSSLAQTIPEQIRAEYEMGGDCQLGGEAFQLVDFNDDRRHYVLVDASKIHCKNPNAWCGSGGCGLSLYVQKGKSWRNILDENVQRYSVEHIVGRRELLVEYRTAGSARYRFVNGCAIEVGTRNPPRC